MASWQQDRTKEGEIMIGRPRKFTKNALISKWEEYKEYCDNREVLCHDFSSKNSEFVSAKLKKSVSYTIEGFCVYCGLSRSTFYSTYMEDIHFSDIVTRIKEECEVDSREKFELGVLPTQLAGIWMNKYDGYGKSDIDVHTEINVQMSDEMKELSQ